MKEMYEPYDVKMQKTIDVVMSDFAGVRAGRANARTTEILDQLALSDRAVTDNQAQAPCEIADWSAAMERLERARAESMEYLRRTLEETGRE